MAWESQALVGEGPAAVGRGLCLKARYQSMQWDKSFGAGTPMDVATLSPQGCALQQNGGKSAQGASRSQLGSPRPSGAVSKLIAGGQAGLVGTQSVMGWSQEPAALGHIQYNPPPPCRGGPTPTRGCCWHRGSQQSHPHRAPGIRNLSSLRDFVPQSKQGSPKAHRPVLHCKQ